MLYFTWVPADPDAVRALVPEQLELAGNSQCFINQYVVDSDDQTSGFAAYSLTYLGADLSGQDTPDGAVPGRWWTHYYNSNADMRAYAAERGVPAEPGETVLEISDGVLTATSSANGTEIIRTTSWDAWPLAKRMALDPAPPLPAAVVFCAICWGQGRILSPAANGEGLIPVVCAHCAGAGAVPSRAA